MKKIILLPLLALFAMFAVSCDRETNYSEYGHFGKAVIHNDVDSGKTITRITITSNSGSNPGTPSTYYNDRVSIIPGRSSDEYELELRLFLKSPDFDFRITVTLDDNTTKSADITAYEDIVNNLYFDGTSLAERN